MYKVKFIKHGDITPTIIDSIIVLKSVAWPYDRTSQLQWISNNIKDSDIHVLLYSDSLLVSYLNLIDINLIVKGKEDKGLGVGNVCALEKGKGWGKELIIRTNEYIVNNNFVGLLLCKQELVKFYSHFGWLIDDSAIIYKVFINDDVKIMYLNFDGNIDELKFNGSSF